MPAKLTEDAVLAAVCKAAAAHDEAVELGEVMASDSLLLLAASMCDQITKTFPEENLIETQLKLLISGLSLGIAAGRRLQAIPEKVD